MKTLFNCISIGVTTLGGCIGKAGFADGQGVNSLFRVPLGLAHFQKNNSIFVTDTQNYRIRKIDSGISIIDSFILF